MNAKRNADGTLTVPGRAEGPDGIIGDGMKTIGPGDPDYAAWDEWLKLQAPAPGTITGQMGGPESISGQAQGATSADPRE